MRNSGDDLCWPDDATLLPLTSGWLLVSRAWATFCRVPAEHEPAVRAVIAGAMRADALPPILRTDLDAHGFFEGPRPDVIEGSTVQIQLTNECNLACGYCSTNSLRPRREELDLPRTKALVDSIRETLGPDGRLSLIGGEPLVVPWAVDVGDYALDVGLHLTLYTNGLRMAEDDELARRVAALSLRGASIRVSLASATEAACDALSGAPRFEQALTALQRLASHGGKPIVDLILTPDQVDATARALPGLRARLPAGTEVALGVLYVSGRERGTRVFASRSQVEDAVDRIVLLAGERVAAAPRGALANRRDGCGCAMGRHLHVRSDGALFGCFRMEEKVGDLAQDGFVETAAQLRASPHPARALPRCQRCPLATLCGGGCRSENVLYTGDPDEPVCGPWRVRVLSELLAEDRIGAVEWSAQHLWAEARARGIEAPPTLLPLRRSRHLVET